jgi:predicted molibdopterin-dependent oxidoreductase YjgC
MVTINIDDQRYEVEEGLTILQALKNIGILIPTLCYHPALKPSGSCKLCTVEVPGRTSGRPIAMLSCILKVKEGLTVKTRGDLVYRARKKAFLNLLRMAPQAHVIRDIAEEFEIDLGPPPDGCIRCRLCIRVCLEIVGPGALKMVKQNGKNYVVPIEGVCIGCGTCANLCKTNAIQVEDKDNVRTIKIRDEIIGRHPLVRCEGCGKLFATPTYLNYIEKRVGPHPDVKQHHKFCQTCAKLFSDRIQSLETRSQKMRMPGHKS